MLIKAPKCQGPGKCTLEFCPNCARQTIQFNVSQKLTKENFTGSSPAPFVGRFGYPEVNVGVLAPPEMTEDAWLYDAPRYWAANNYQIPQIMDYRSSLINSRFKMHVKHQHNFLEISQEVGMASKPVDLEISLTKKPQFRVNTDAYLAPTGPNATLQKLQITSNPKISSKVDKVVSDTDLLATDGLLYLNSKGFDENFLSRLLSVGTLGINRKLVPTRWSITAVDDTLAKKHIEKIKNYPEADYTAYFGSHLGNYYLILTFPYTWQYELFEMYQPKTKTNPTAKLYYTTDYEPFRGRTYYAENTVGGYYAARLSITEKLDAMKRQASILAIRVISDDYSVPLGVWVVREAARKATQSKPIRFASRELMLNYARILLKKKFDINADEIFSQSLLLRNLSQSRLSAFC